MKTIKTLTIIPLLFFALTAWADSEAGMPHLLFQQANAAYDSGDYAQAVELYNEIADNGYDSWELRYNLGNAYYRLDETGLSILNYERALRMAPGKKTIKDNLALARSHTADNIEELPHPFLLDWINAVTGIMPLRGWLVTVVILVILGCAALSIFLIAKEYRIRRSLFIVSMTLLLLIVLSAIGAAISAHHATNDKEAIITAPLVVVKGSPDAKSVDKFVLHEGTKISIGDEQDEWWQIEIADGKSGWINGGAERI
ncbi:MAG: tetratricopeptide repeat protein [Bacteroidales bacterium]|nr:tetratricopeptide repeat protein [Bacteroidales bacterium]